jgi:hypothetical protein
MPSFKLGQHPSGSGVTSKSQAASESVACIDPLA